MNDRLRQWAVVITTIATIAINMLAVLLPFNNLTTKEISDSFRIYFVPAGYVFSIWGIIYIGMLAYMVFQLLPAQKENPRLRATGWWMVLAGVANSLWLFTWHYQFFAFMVPVMLVLLLSLIIAYIRLRDGAKISSVESWSTRVFTGVYLGWISVATTANITDLLYWLRWDGFGIPAATWMLIVLVVVAALGTAMNFIRRDAAYSAVLLWALGGIVVNLQAMDSTEFPAAASLIIPTWVAFGAIALTLLVALVIPRKTGA